VLAVFFHRVWKPKILWRYGGEVSAPAKAASFELPPRRVLWGWFPFLLLGAFVVVWSLPSITRELDKTTWKQPVPALHLGVVRMPPVVPVARPEPALFDGAWLAAPGTGVFLAGLVAGPLAGLSFKRTLQVFVRCLDRLKWSIVAILAMLGTGFITRYCGMDATMGMAMAHTGVMFPLFGTLIGWMGVALSGTDAGSNALFGSFQMITAQQLHLSPILMGAANSAGGVMGKMIAAQSLVIGCAATGQEGQEGLLFRAVLKHSIVLALAVGMIVLLYAYVFPGAVPGSDHNF
jgi:lactate permease